jgi:UDP-N-acetylmuramate dehydrogenase
MTLAGTTVPEALVRRLGDACPGAVRRDEPLSAHSYWAIGGPADLLVEPGTPAEVAAALRILKDSGVAVAVIGGGTNVLFPDEGFRGVVLKVAGRLNRFQIEGCRVKAEAGVWVPRLARTVGCRGLTGIEHTVGIPGTLGGLVLMNGGSQRKGIGTHVVRVSGWDATGNPVSFTREECAFAYRESRLQTNGCIVTGVELELASGDAASIRREMISIMKSRRLKFPKRLPNCGSVFVSDPAMYEKFGPPGKMIEDAGLKGTRIGGALIPELHGNFIVNTGGATAEDVKALVRLVRGKVHERTDFWLVCEVRLLIPDGTFVPLHERL